MWGISASYPSISSYTEAQRKYDTTKPLRGRHDDFRPLDMRSSRAKSRIEKQGEEYVIFCYTTEIVRYYPNGDVRVRTGGWSSTTTCAAISALSPFNCRMNKGDVVVSKRAGYYDVPGAGNFIVPNNGLLFKPSKEGELIPVNPPVATECRRRVLKDKAKIARTLFKDVPPRIRAYSAAFKGGVLPSGTMRIHGNYAFLGEVFSRGVITEQEIEMLTWYFIPTQYDYKSSTSRIANAGELPVKAFWKAVYQSLSIIETYSVELLYGEVAK